jgi:antitoxin ParD1/3/4
MKSRSAIQATAPPTTRPTMNVSLTRHLQSFVQTRVASGRYQSVSEVVREGLRLLEQREADREDAKGLRKKIAIGLEQARRGELLDGEQVFRELETRTRRRRAA